MVEVRICWKINPEPMPKSAIYFPFHMFQYKNKN